MLKKQQLNVGWNHPDYPKNAMHVYAQNSYCDEWNHLMLQEHNGILKTCHVWDTKRQFDSTS